MNGGGREIAVDDELQQRNSPLDGSGRAVEIHIDRVAELHRDRIIKSYISCD